MTPSLAQVLIHLYPQAIPNADFVVLDRGDGQGAQIISWDAARLGPPPDASAIAAAQVPVAQQVAADAIDARTQQLIGLGFSFSGQNFSLSIEAQLNLTALYSYRALLTYPLSLTTVANTAFVIPNQAALEAIVGAALAATKGSLDGGRNLKARVMAANSLAAIDAVVDTR